ncbi:ABC transporter permease [Nocardioides immobilis]|uniref:ABC transporter permease n=1 Tax=Nocardioides immobilis TaxID=2049295 RepID=A0A417Y2Z9_9ACTN|nr:ABC transporter permease [Nocardioides immobilis]RHW27040.1 ABC transporter permease [Nocardioides immobilis]
MSLVVDVLSGGVSGGTSIMYAGVGETVSERAGVINLGTEGSMLVGALGAYAAGVETGNPWIGVLAGATAGGALALVHGYLVVRRGASQFASGLSLLFLALGLTSLFGAPYVGQPVVGFDTWEVPLLSDLPVLGPVLFQHDPLLYLGYLVVPLVWVVLFKTRVGLLGRTAGERADSLTVHGYSVHAIRIGAVTAGGVLAGMGGAHLATAYANAWFENMVAGRGFIAVALVIFATWSPWRVLGGAYLFGCAIALGPALQARAFEINQFLLDAVPFVLTLAVLTILGKRTLSASPAELKRVFENAPPSG